MNQPVDIFLFSETNIYTKTLSAAFGTFREYFPKNPGGCISYSSWSHCSSCGSSLWHFWCYLIGGRILPSQCTSHGTSIGGRSLKSRQIRLLGKNDEFYYVLLVHRQACQCPHCRQPRRHPHLCPLCPLCPLLQRATQVRLDLFEHREQVTF